MLTQSSRSAKPPLAAAPVPVNAPLFRRLVDSLSEERRSVVLDLGSVRPEMVALLTPFRCRLEIADVAEGLPELDAEPDPSLWRAKAEALLPPARKEPADIVFCWDLLNYVQRPALSAFMDCVADRMRPGAFVHALIAYSATQMPVRPSQYSPLPDGRLLEVVTTDVQRSAPRYSSDDLRRALPGFTAESVMLLKNGMQEYLFRH